jgi:hypothetical protein
MHEELPTTSQPESRARSGPIGDLDASCCVTSEI